MKALALGLTTVLALTGTAQVAKAQVNAEIGLRAGAGVTVDLGTFRRALAPYGFWTDLDPWGQVWVPTGMQEGWEPYTMGHWVYTDDGWTWASDFDWGWAPFHYGRWALSADMGWVWVPGDVWAPAWVAWRSGEGLAGWAPLPPEDGWQLGIGFTVPDIDAYIPQGVWVFVGDRDFARDNLHRYIHREGRFDRDYWNTRDVTRYGERNDHVWDRGIDPDRIERATGRALPRFQVIARGEPGPAQERERDHQLRIYRPRVRNGREEGAFGERPRSFERGRRGGDEGILPEARSFEALRNRELNQLFGFGEQPGNRRGADEQGRRSRESGRRPGEQRPQAATGPFTSSFPGEYQQHQEREGRQQRQAFERSPRQYEQFQLFGQAKEQAQQRQFEQRMHARQREGVQGMQGREARPLRGPGEHERFQREQPGSRDHSGGNDRGDHDHGGGRR